MGHRVSTTETGTLTITNARLRAAAALAPVSDGDPDVHVSLVDALHPPALMLGWADPWLSAQPRPSNRVLDARLAVWCVAGRLEPGPGVEVLEGLVALVIDRLRADGYPWGIPMVQAPRAFPMGNVDYIAAQVVYTVPVSTSETEA